VQTWSWSSPPQSPLIHESSPERINSPVSNEELQYHSPERTNSPVFNEEPSYYNPSFILCGAIVQISFSSNILPRSPPIFKVAKEQMIIQDGIGIFKPNVNNKIIKRRRMVISAYRKKKTKTKPCKVYAHTKNDNEFKTTDGRHLIRQNDNETTDQFKRDIAIRQQLIKHKNILQTLQIYKNSQKHESLYVLEYTIPLDTITPPVNVLLNQLISALSFLQTRNIIHCDVTLSNITQNTERKFIKLQNFSNAHTNDRVYISQLSQCQPIPHTEWNINRDVYCLGLIIDQIFSTPGNCCLKIEKMCKVTDFTYNLKLIKTEIRKLLKSHVPKIPQKKEGCELFKAELMDFYFPPSSLLSM
jgi:serine/threonine protein kinase